MYPQIDAAKILDEAFGIIAASVQDITMDPDTAQKSQLAELAKTFPPKEGITVELGDERFRLSIRPWTFGWRSPMLPGIPPLGTKIANGTFGFDAYWENPYVNFLDSAYSVVYMKPLLQAAHTQAALGWVGFISNVLNMYNLVVDQYIDRSASGGTIVPVIFFTNGEWVRNFLAVDHLLGNPIKKIDEPGVAHWEPERSGMTVRFMQIMPDTSNEVFRFLFQEFPLARDLLSDNRTPIWEQNVPVYLPGRHEALFYRQGLLQANLELDYGVYRPEGNRYFDTRGNVTSKETPGATPDSEWAIGYIQNIYTGEILEVVRSHRFRPELVNNEKSRALMHQSGLWLEKGQRYVIPSLAKLKILQDIQQDLHGRADVNAISLNPLTGQPIRYYSDRDYYQYPTATYV
jgi:hypothetical protein